MTNQETQGEAIQTVRERKQTLEWESGETVTLHIATADEWGRIEAVVTAAREWREAQDNEDPRIDALLDALAALDPTLSKGNGGSLIQADSQDKAAGDPTEAPDPRQDFSDAKDAYGGTTP